MHGPLDASLHRYHPGDQRARRAALRDCRGAPRFGSSGQRHRHRAARLSPLSQEMVKKIEVQDLRLSYGHKEVIHGISFDVYANEILGIIGPAKSGKSSLLRCINRTIEFSDNAKVGGTIKIDDHDVQKL